MSQDTFDRLSKVYGVRRDILYSGLLTVHCDHGKRTEKTDLPKVEIPIDSGMGLSITIDKFRVVINKTLSTRSLINQLLIKRVGVSDNEKCVSVTQW